jgi:hypothetical protein
MFYTDQPIMADHGVLPSEKAEQLPSARDNTTNVKAHDKEGDLHLATPKCGQVGDEFQSETPPRDLKGYKWIICVLAIFSSVFLYALDNTIVATIQPAIIQSLGELDKLPWVSVAYQVTSVASDLTWYHSRPRVGKANPPTPDKVGE